MKTGIVVIRPQSKHVKNIGDYIQPVAAMQYFDNIDYYIDREDLYCFNSSNRQNVKVIICGTYVWDSAHWPPSEDIEPLFISMHIFPMAEKELFSESNIAYWKEHAPIGCRDIGTYRMFKKRNIPAYYSSCITLTLGDKYKFTGERRGYCFVDPYIPLPLFKDGASFRKIQYSEIIPFAIRYLKYKPKVNKLIQNEFFSLYGPNWGHSHYKGIKLFFMKRYHALQFYFLYSQIFSDEILFNAEYITHMYRLRKDQTESDKDLLAIAEELIEKYAQFKMVVTSRIHAALPCLGLETPVIFCLNSEMESNSIKFNTPGRFEGIIDLFRILKIGKDKISTDDDLLKKVGKIDKSTVISNKSDYKKYATDLKNRIHSFVHKF